jgi:hypothetical protein
MHKKHKNKDQSDEFLNLCFLRLFAANLFLVL